MNCPKLTRLDSIYIDSVLFISVIDGIWKSSAITPNNRYRKYTISEIVPIFLNFLPAAYLWH